MERLAPKGMKRSLIRWLQEVHFRKILDKVVAGLVPVAVVAVLVADVDWCSHFCLSWKLGSLIRFQGKVASHCPG